MNRWLIIVALLIPFLAAAQEESGPPPTTQQSQDDGDQSSENQGRLPVSGLCAIEGSIYQTAARSRDEGQSPQQTYQQLFPMHRAGIPDQDLKDAINNVYFDDRFANAGGQVLANQMFQICMNAHNPNYRPFEPLK